MVGIWQINAESTNGLDSDNNGYVDDTQGWDFVNDDNNPTDDHGHGTNVAGIATANGNNALGYSGVDWNCKLMVCKILDENNSGFYSWQVDAIYYAVDHGARIINMSVGGFGFSSSLQDAVNYAYDNGVTIVACMMNEDNNVTYYPAGYQNTIGVGSTNANDQRTSPFFWSSTSGSNYGNHIDVIAPGNYIYGLDYNSNSNYNSYWGGTSQAAPLVAGIGSLLLAQDPSRTPDDIRSILRNTAVDQVGNASEDVSGFDIYYGYGRVNAHQALLQSVSTEEVISSENSSITIYPNPSSDILNLISKTGINKLSIVSVTGAEVYNKESPDDFLSLKIDVSAFAKGTYFINVTTSENQKIQSFKTIIQ